MNSQTLAHLTLGFLLFPLVVLIIVFGSTKVVESHAQVSSTNMMSGSMMMDSNEEQAMVDQMRQDYGSNWQQECQQMMQDLSVNEAG